MRRLRGQSGFTLIEVLTTMSLLAIVLGATVSAFASFNRNERVNRVQNDAQETARGTITLIARQLRNLASPEDYDPQAVEKAEAYDFVFKTVDPVKPDNSQNVRNIKRLRYCLAPSSGGSAVLWRQQQTWTAPNPPPSFSTGSCPDGSWGNQRTVIEQVTNRDRSPQEPIFRYSPSGSQLSAIKSVQVELFVDADIADNTPSTRLASGVFLRNQNRAPVVSCTATYGAGGQVVLNGSGTYDPEGHPLAEYEWFANGSSTGKHGIVAYWSAARGTYTVKLEAVDHGGLAAEANCPGTVTVP